MAWHRHGIGVSMIALSIGLLAGCANDVPNWALSKNSLADDISAPADAARPGATLGRRHDAAKPAAAA